VPTLGELPYWFQAATVVALGLAFGSFLNVVIYRLPRGENLAVPGSRCPHCKKPIRAWDNLPLFGWLFLLGRARCCGARVSARYPLVEALGGLAAWAVFQVRVSPLPEETLWWKALLLFLPYFALALGLIAAAFIDLEHMILPDEITLGGTALGILSVPVRGDIGLEDSLLGAVIGFLIIWLPFDLLYRKIRGRPGMGLGDAKLTMLAGAWFGWPGAVFALLAGAVQGTVGAVVVYAAQGKIEEPEAVKEERRELERAIVEAETEEERRELEEELALDPLGSEAEEGLGQSRMPFGPFLVLAILEFLFFGGFILESYLSWVWGV
jgi:leader peptidase (prepilin peptidase)/N-methyltransferase